jgi:hypothetical protein
MSSRGACRNPGGVECCADRNDREIVAGVVWRRDDADEYLGRVDRVLEDSEDWLLPLAEPFDS